MYILYFEGEFDTRSTDGVLPGESLWLVPGTHEDDPATESLKALS